MPNAPQTHRSPHRATSAQREAYRGNSRQRGYDRNWEKVRAAYVAIHPLCEWCERNGLTVIVAEVDHIIPIKDRPDLRLDMDNLQSLCKSCHQVKTLGGSEDTQHR